MRIAITGASGFLSQQILPYLRSKENDFVFVGRDKVRLKEIFGAEAKVANYDELDTAFKDVDAVLHFATMGPSKSGTYDEYEEANVELVKTVLSAAKKSTAKLLIFKTRLNVEDNKNSFYAITKLKAEAYLSKHAGSLAVVTLALPAIYGDDAYSGKLKVLYKLPKFFRNIAFSILSALKPTVNIDLVADVVNSALKERKSHYCSLTDRQMKNSFYAMIMRTIDLSFALAVFLLFWWLLLIVWIAIRLSSAGPGIFAQQRVGLRGKEFTCYKFRTMYQGTKIAGTHEIAKDNVTNVGRFIRKYKIDELPQAWNILCNEMSLVGPRPCLPIQTELIQARNNLGVLDIKCGLTGLAQVRGIDMSEPIVLSEVDAEYSRIRTLTLNFKLIIQTFLGKGLEDRVAKIMEK